MSSNNHAQTPENELSACSHGPIDSTDTNIVETSSCLETTQQQMTNFTIIDWMTLVHVHAAVIFGIPGTMYHLYSLVYC